MESRGECLVARMAVEALGTASTGPGAGMRQSRRVFTSMQWWAVGAQVVAQLKPGRESSGADRSRGDDEHGRQ